MAFAINLKTVIAYTGRLEIRFKKPLEVGQTYYIRACIDDFKKKYIKTSGVIADKENKLYATAKALFIVAQV
jgi:acyl-CoA thioesterase FadM